MNSKKILITGGAGYKGTVLVQLLVAKGYLVTVLDTFNFGADAVLGIAALPEVSFVRKDVRSIEKSDLVDFDVIVHLAGIVGFPACASSPFDACTINVDSTQRIVDLIDDKQLLIFASTTSVYGVAENVSDETSTLHPVSLYGQNKLAAERIVLSRKNSIVLRVATVFGLSPRMRDTLLVNDFTKRAVQERAILIFDGASKRPFIHVKDAAAAYEFSINKSALMIGQIWNVGASTLNYSKNEMAKQISLQVPTEILSSSRPDPDKRDYVISFDKLAGIGFVPRITLDEGIKEMIKYYKI